MSRTATIASNEDTPKHESRFTSHRHLWPPAVPMIELVQTDLAAERIAVNSEQARGTRLIAMKPLQHALDKFFFKFVDRFIEMDSALHHQANQRFQLLLHSSTLRTRFVRSRTIPAVRLAEFMAR
jgi:hypothetical protein